MCDLGHLKVKLGVEFRHQSYFPMILIFWRIFWPTFKIVSQRGQNFDILTPWVELFSQKSQMCNFDLGIWGTYRWAIQSKLGSFWRGWTVVDVDMLNWSDFTWDRTGKMRKCQYWTKNLMLTWLMSWVFLPNRGISWAFLCWPHRNRLPANANDAKYPKKFDMWTCCG